VSWRCWFGFHQWEPWPHVSTRKLNKPIRVKTHDFWLELPDSYLVHVRQRCERCNKHTEFIWPSDKMYVEERGDS
jgi:hypothetical protein